MKGSLSAQLKMALFGAGEDDHLFATRQPSASPRNQRAKQYDGRERLRARARDLAQFAADHLADPDDTPLGDNSADEHEDPVVTAPNPDNEEGGFFVVNPDPVVEPIFPSTTTDPNNPNSTATIDPDPTPADDSDFTSTADPVTTIIPEPMTAPAPTPVFSKEQVTPFRPLVTPRRRLSDIPRI